MDFILWQVLESSGMTMKREIDCRGVNSRQINRRACLQTTVPAGMAGLTLPTLLTIRAEAKAVNRPLDDTAVIQIWLGGGPARVRPSSTTPAASCRSYIRARCSRN